jgi:hypothetical protein
MVGSINTRAGRLSIDTHGSGIELRGQYVGLGVSDTHTHYLTVEQCQVLIHALARALGEAQSTFEDDVGYF